MQIPRLASIVETNNMMVSIAYRKPESKSYAGIGTEKTTPLVTSPGPKSPITIMADLPMHVIYDYERLRGPLVQVPVEEGVKASG